jgi:deoxyxylulose-5-phosphate synthase
MAKLSKPVPSLSAVATPPQAQPIQIGDLHNLVIAARQGLPGMTAEALGHVAASIGRIEAVIATAQAQQAPEKKDA